MCFDVLWGVSTASCEVCTQMIVVRTDKPGFDQREKQEKSCEAFKPFIKPPYVTYVNMERVEKEFYSVLHRVIL